MLTESGERQHHCYVKSESELLFDKMCLTGFTRADLLENQKNIAMELMAGRRGSRCQKRGETPFLFSGGDKDIRKKFGHSKTACDDGRRLGKTQKCD